MTLPRIKAEIIPCGDEQNWLAERRKRVHASEVAAVLGQSAWGSALSVWADKTSPSLVEATNERFAIGHELEEPIRAMYRRKFGGKLHAWPDWTIAVSREREYLGCTPDGLCEDSGRSGIGLLEIKTASEFSRHEWQESIPLAYQIQVQASLAVTGLQWGVVAVLIGVASIERYFVERNDTFISAMLEVLADFATCLELRTPPEVDGSAATTKALARLHPADNGLAVRLPEGSDEQLAKLRRANGLAKKLTARADAIENQLRAAIGDNTFGVTPDGKWVSWKSQTRKSFTVAESTRRVLRECKEPHLIEFADGSGTTGVDYKVAERVQIPEWIKTKLLSDKGRCRWCGCQLTRHSATIEHVVALSKGGTNDLHNLDIACRTCNETRGDDATLPVSQLALKG